MAYGRPSAGSLTLRRHLLVFVVLGVLWNSGVSGDWSRVQRSRWSDDDAMSFARDHSDADHKDQMTTRRTTGRVVGIAEELQLRIVNALWVNCLTKDLRENTSEFSSPVNAALDEDADGEHGPATDKATCERTWDSIACWPETPAGQLAVLPCPNYINRFRTDGVASRQCMENGQWFVLPGTNKTWTNYTQCVSIQEGLPETPNALFAEHIQSFRIIYYIGYSLSFIVLLVAVTIMLSLRKLRCPRNSLHINLFFSFILRALIALSRDMIQTDARGLFPQRGDATFWHCRLLMTIFNFATTANHSWIFVEGLYLHNLLFVSVFSETATILPYVVFGWTMPLACIVPWAIVRMTKDNNSCWEFHHNGGYLWIVKGPLIVLSIVNFCFFLNVIRILFTKLHAFNSPDSRKFRHWKLAKSTLVLIPLFGVPYLVFVAFQDRLNPLTEVIKLYFEQTFGSFNGIIVAMLYCFFNGEVQSELRKRWQCNREVSVRDRRRGTTVTSAIFPSRSGQQSFRSAAGNSTVMLDQDDQLGTVYELTAGSTKCAGNGRVNHVRHPSSGSWNSESSAIQMKTLHANASEAGEEGGRGKGDVGEEDDPLEDAVTTDDDGVESSGFQQQERNGRHGHSLIIIIDN